MSSGAGKVLNHLVEMWVTVAVTAEKSASLVKKVRWEIHFPGVSFDEYIRASHSRFCAIVKAERERSARRATRKTGRQNILSDNSAQCKKQLQIYIKCVPCDLRWPFLQQSSTPLWYISSYSPSPLEYIYVFNNTNRKSIQNSLRRFHVQSFGVTANTFGLISPSGW